MKRANLTTCRPMSREEITFKAFPTFGVDYIFFFCIVKASLTTTTTTKNIKQQQTDRQLTGTN